MTQEYIPFHAIVGEIKRFCDLKSTGTMYVATKANRSAQIVFERGEIVFVYFYNKRGQDALDLMVDIVAGRYRFQEGVISARRVSLPPTTDVINFLLRGKNGGNSLSQNDQQQISVGGGLDSAQKTVLEAALAEYIGPMAAIICEDYLSSAANVTAAVDALASEIPSADQAEKFKSQMRVRLGQPPR